VDALRTGRVRAEQLVSDFVDLNGLPTAYDRMRNGEILKAMVMFD
jgi:Zn-dependent alcohol dehydrogenase